MKKQAAILPSKIAVRPDLHEIMKRHANEKGLKLYSVTNDVVELGLKMKRLIPAEEGTPQVVPVKGTVQ